MLVFYISAFIASLIISMVGEALSCVFIFYCFDNKFRSMGIEIVNTPAAIRQFNMQEGPHNETVPSASEMKQNP